MEKTQREYYLNEQMKAIQRELGEGEDGKNELDELAEQINEAGLPSSPGRGRAQAAEHGPNERRSYCCA